MIGVPSPFLSLTNLLMEQRVKSKVETARALFGDVKTMLEAVLNEPRTSHQLPASPHGQPRQEAAHARTATAAPNNYGPGPRVAAGGGGGSRNRRSQLGSSPYDRNGSVVNQPLITKEHIKTFAFFCIMLAWIVTAVAYGIDYQIVREQWNKQVVLDYTGAKSHN